MLLDLDISLFRAINGLAGYPLIDQAMLVVSSHWLWIAVLVLTVAVALWCRKLRALAPVLAALVVATGIADLFSFQVLKPAVGRYRPCYALQEVQLIQERCGGDYGFPSNHASNAMAAAVVLMAAFRHRRNPVVVLLSCALVVGFSRIYLGVHYPGDIIGGFLVGGIIGLPFNWWLTRRLSLKLAGHVEKDAGLS